MPDVKRIGLTLLSGSEGDLTGPCRANVIFVHGLRGHPRHTWEDGETSKSNLDADEESRGSIPQPVFWLEEFLKHDIADARVWTYGYHAELIRIFQTNNTNSALKLGEDLAKCLEWELGDAGPIIFVAHSFGGIIIKAALYRSDWCRLRTKAIIFLGTPHRRSLSREWGDITSNLALLALEDSKDAIVETQDEMNEVLDNIHDEFKTILYTSSIRIHSFQESRGMSGMKGRDNKVVDDFSSKLDLPPARETVESIDANHVEMTKCRDRADHPYSTILGILRQLIDSQISRVNSRHLCKSCEAMGLDPFFAQYPNRNPRGWQIPGVKYDADCLFCLFFSEKKVNSKNHPFSSYGLESFSVKDIFGLKDERFPPVFPIPDSDMFAVVPLVGEGYLKTHRTPTGDLARSDNLFMIQPPKELGISACQISDYIDYTIIKHWLDFCGTHHTKGCKLKELLPLPGLHLIECKARRRIAWPAKKWIPSYVTLSYVWGSYVARDIDSFPSGLPQLIIDAMELTIRLGYQYLWVDRYCIPQDNEKAKHAQIHRMDEIYSRSALTIIAAAGSSPTDGLPGVSSPRTRKQGRLKVGNVELLQVFAGVADDVQRSEWNSRGWTYQEGVLAYRKLVFTSSQVYYQCSGMWCIESLWYPLKEMHTKDLQHFHKLQSPPYSQRSYRELLPRVFPRQRIGGDYDSPIIRIEEYSEKQFTFEKDALDAFRGVLNRSIRSPAGGLQGHMCGVLIWPSDPCQDSFIKGLRWVQMDIKRASKPLLLPRRRNEFPSWSWIGWKFSPDSAYRFHDWVGSYSYTTELLLADTGKEAMNSMKISVEFDDSEIIQWSSGEYKKAMSKSFSGVNAKALHVQGFVGNFDVPRLDAPKAVGRGGFLDYRSAGSYLVGSRDVQRLHQIATERNTPGYQDGCSFTCWVMQRYDGVEPNHHFTLMALVPAPGLGSYERVDVFDIVYDGDTKQRVSDIARTLGWKMTDIKIY